MRQNTWKKIRSGKPLKNKPVVETLKYNKTTNKKEVSVEIYKIKKD